ncbi:hypothetical protein O0L34_g12934 [Tuta absoluta]|nr:hypothetical protein O0L34_g12934 [Tuta absoluta]
MRFECAKCQKAIAKKDLLKCSSCSLTFHADCSQHPARLFDCMTKERKLAWKCKVCVRIRNKVEVKTPIKKNILTGGVSGQKRPETAKPASSTPSAQQKITEKPSTSSETPLQSPNTITFSQDTGKNCSETAPSDKKSPNVSNPQNNSNMDVTNLDKTTYKVTDYKNDTEDDTFHSLQLSAIHSNRSKVLTENTTLQKKEVIINAPVKNSFELLSGSIESDTDSEDDYSRDDSTTTAALRRSCPELNNLMVINELEELREKCLCWKINFNQLKMK